VEGVHVASAPLDDVDAFVAHVKPWLAPLLERAGAAPPARIPGAAPQIVRYLDGEAEYIGIIDAPNREHRVDFGRSAHIYDVRARRYLGEADSISVSEGNGGVAVYALLPERPESVQVGAPSEVHRGEIVSYEVDLKSAGPAVRRVFSVRVYSPDGALQHMYGMNAEGEASVARAGFRLALNDPRGEWRIAAADAATGLTGEARFVVR
jgi:hypothetical protein